MELVALTMLLIAVQECLRRSGARLPAILFCTAPIALTPHWARINEFGVFAWAKLYTVLFSAGWFTALRFTDLGRRDWARRFAFALFALNIFEAVLVDALAWRPVQGLNAATGLLLILELPRGPDSVRIHRTGRVRDLRYHGIQRGQIIGFSLWNWTFLYLNFPSIAGHHIAVLAAAAVVGWIDPSRWLAARMYILGFDLIALATVGVEGIPLVGDTSSWSDSTIEWVAAGITWAFTAGRTLRRFRIPEVNR